MAATRTDLHCPSNFIATDYTFIESFGTVTHNDCGEIFIEQYGYEYFTPEVNSALGGIYADNVQKCDICGAAYVHGAIFSHDPSQTFLTVGQQCAGNVGLAVNKRIRLNVASRLKRLARERKWRRDGATKARAFLAINPELACNLVQKHRILRDMSRNLLRWGSMSESQMRFAAKLANDVRNPQPTVAAIAIPSHLLEGRVTIKGEIVTVKEVESDYGWQTKMLVKVEATDGEFKLWGTCPSALADVGSKIVGATVRFDCKIAKSNDDEAFGFINRPTKPSILIEA
jgi:hypothetical protein